MMSFKLELCEHKENIIPYVKNTLIFSCLYYHKLGAFNTTLILEIKKCNHEKFLNYLFNIWCHVTSHVMLGGKLDQLKYFKGTNQTKKLFRDKQTK